MTEREAALPPGWTRASLDDIVVPKVKQGPPDGAEFRYVDIGSVDRSSKVIEKIDPQSTGSAPSRARQWIRQNDVIVSMTRPNLNAVAMVPAALEGAICSTGFDVLRAIATEPRWIFAHVRTAKFIDEMSALVRGALYPAVNSTQVRASELPLPPLNEQKRIVAKIEALRERADAAKAALDAIPPLLEKFRQSVLAAAFRGDLTKAWRAAHPDVEPATELLARIRAERRRLWEEANPGKKYKAPEPVDPTGLPVLPAGWCWASVEELCWEGPTNGYSGATEGGSAGTLTMKLSATTAGRLLLDDSTTKRLTETVARESKFWLQDGDLLVQRANSLPYLGAAAIFTGHDEPMVYPDLMMRLRSSNTTMTAWLWRYFNTLACRTWFRSNATGTAGNMPKINGGLLKRTAVPIPNTDEAHQVLDHVAQAFEVIDAMEGRCSILEAHQASINQSILAKAFRGELVPQDPNDEPASVLLERIRAEREAAGTQPKRGARKPRAPKARQATLPGLDAPNGPE